MFGILAQLGSLVEASHISFYGQAHLERKFFPSRVSLACARLVKVLGFFALATRSRRRGSRLSLGFTRSRFSTRSRLLGSLAVVVLMGSPPSSLSTRGDDTAPTNELDLLLCRYASLSPLGFICFAVGDEMLAPFLVAHLLSSALSSHLISFLSSHLISSASQGSLSYDLDRFSTAGEP
jgi:hypothetical protein